MFPELPPIASPTEEVLDELAQDVDIDGMYNLPKKVRFCRDCVISNQRPRIRFDSKGVCSACNYWKKKKKIDWSKRKRQFERITDRHRKHNGEHDVIVPSSGGKDSVYVALKLKREYGMTPLTVTWSPALYTKIGFENFRSHLHAGLDNVLVTPNPVTHRKLTQIATVVMGEPFQPFVYGQANAPLKVAANRNITLIVDGENGEAEYGGDVEAQNLKGFDLDDSEEYWFSNFPVEYWSKFGVQKTELHMYSPPQVADFEEGLTRIFYSYFHNWQPQAHYYFAAEHSNFKTNPRGSSEMTYSKYASLDDLIDPFHYYFGLLKFGIGRATSDAAHEIRENRITRDDAVQLVNKFDNSRPSDRAKSIFLEYTGLDHKILRESVNKWRNNRLWLDSESLAHVVE